MPPNSGYAALTHFPENTSALTVEYEINLVGPAAGDQLEADRHESLRYATPGSKPASVASSPTAASGRSPQTARVAQLLRRGGSARPRVGYKVTPEPRSLSTPTPFAPRASANSLLA